MRNPLRARRPITALAAFAIAATTVLLSACGPSGSGSPVAQQSPFPRKTPVGTYICRAGYRPRRQKKPPPLMVRPSC